MSRRDPLSGGQIVGWTAAGVVVGLVSGALLAQWLGDVNRRRLRTAVDQLRRPAEPALTPSALAEAARTALGQSEELAGLGLEVRRVARGVVELRGWVPSRALRARAARAVLGVPGVESVVNNVLVRGEDDEPEARVIPLSDRPA